MDLTFRTVAPRKGGMEKDRAARGRGAGSRGARFPCWGSRSVGPASAASPGRAGAPLRLAPAELCLLTPRGPGETRGDAAAPGLCRRRLAGRWRGGGGAAAFGPQGGPSAQGGRPVSPRRGGLCELVFSMHGHTAVCRRGSCV